MLIKEYRIPMPMSVDEYRIAQLYMIQVSSGTPHLTDLRRSTPISPPHPSQVCDCSAPNYEMIGHMPSDAGGERNKGRLCADRLSSFKLSEAGSHHTSQAVWFYS